MRLTSNAVGRDVYRPWKPSTTLGESGAKYVTLLYVDSSSVVARLPDGSIYDGPNSGFADWDFYTPVPDTDDLRRLGDDLVSSIVNAHTDSLRNQTPHMREAIAAWHEATSRL